MKGQLVLTTAALIELLERGGHAFYFRYLEATAESATCETHWSGHEEPQRATYTIEQARDAGLLAQKPWRSNPGALLRKMAASRSTAMSSTTFWTRWRAPWEPNTIDGVATGAGHRAALEFLYHTRRRYESEGNFDRRAAFVAAQLLPVARLDDVRRG